MMAWVARTFKLLPPYVQLGMRNLDFSRALLHGDHAGAGHLQNGEGAHHGLEGVQPLGGVRQLHGQGGGEMSSTLAP